MLSVSTYQADVNKIRSWEQQTTVGMCFSRYCSVRRGLKRLTTVNNDAENKGVRLKFRLAPCTSLGTFRKAVL
jgi:hypothetical protein